MWGVVLISANAMERPSPLWMTLFPRLGVLTVQMERKLSSRHACLHFLLLLVVDMMCLTVSRSWCYDFVTIMGCSLELWAKISSVSALPFVRVFSHGDMKEHKFNSTFVFFVCFASLDVSFGIPLCFSEWHDPLESFLPGIPLFYYYSGLKC